MVIRWFQAYSYSYVIVILISLVIQEIEYNLLNILNKD